MSQIKAQWVELKKCLSPANFCCNHPEHISPCWLNKSLIIYKNISPQACMGAAASANAFSKKIALENLPSTLNVSLFFLFCFQNNSQA